LATAAAAAAAANARSVYLGFKLPSHKLAEFGRRAANDVGVSVANSTLV